MPETPAQPPGTDAIGLREFAGLKPHTVRPAQPIACGRPGREPRDQVLAMWVMQTVAGPRLMLATDFGTMSLSAVDLAKMLRTASAAGMMGGESECALVALEAILPFATLAPEWAIKAAQDAIRGGRGAEP